MVITCGALPQLIIRRGCQNRCKQQLFVAPPSDKSNSCYGTDKRARRRFDGLAYLSDDAGCMSPRAGRRAGPPPAPSKHAGTVVEEENEKVRSTSIKRSRSEESARIFSPAIIWVSYIYLWCTFVWPAILSFRYLCTIPDRRSPSILSRCSCGVHGYVLALEHLLKLSTGGTYLCKPDQSYI